MFLFLFLFLCFRKYAISLKIIIKEGRARSFGFDAYARYGYFVTYAYRYIIASMFYTITIRLEVLYMLLYHTVDDGQWEMESQSLGARGL